MLNRLITGKNPMLDIVVRKNGNGSRFRTMRRGSPPVKNRSCTMQPLHWNERLPLSRTLSRRRFYEFPSFGIPSGIVKRIKPHVCVTYGPLPHPKEQPSDQVFKFGKILPPVGGTRPSGNGYANSWTSRLFLWPHDPVLENIAKTATIIRKKNQNPQQSLRFQGVSFR